MARIEEIYKYTRNIQVWQKYILSNPGLIISGNYEGIEESPKVLMDCHLENCTFNNCNFDGTNFNRIYFNDVEFINCELTKTQMCNMQAFQEVSFINCIVSPITFNNTTFSDCKFGDCEIISGVFHSPEFIRCDLSTLSGLSPEMLENTLGDEDTLLPKDINRPAAWDLFINVENPLDGDHVLIAETHQLEITGQDAKIEHNRPTRMDLADGGTFPKITITRRNLPAIKEQAELYSQFCRDQIERMRGANDPVIIDDNQTMFELLNTLETGYNDIAKLAGQNVPESKFHEFKGQIHDKIANILKACDDTISGDNGKLLNTISNVALAGVSISFLTMMGAPALLATPAVFGLLGYNFKDKTKKDKNF